MVPPAVMGDNSEVEEEGEGMAQEEMEEGWEAVEEETSMAAAKFLIHLA